MGKRARGAALVSGLAIGGVLAAAAVVAAREVRLSLGARPDPEPEERIRRSPQYRNGVFHNSVPAAVLPPGAGGAILREYLFGGQRRRPTLPVPVVAAEPPATPDPDGLYVTWYGHSAALIEIDGRRVLFDPIWGDRCSPSRLVGPRRLHPPPVPLDALPALDAIVISHDHYDHLDLPTVRTLAATREAPFLVPLGVGAHLRRWGVPGDRIVELDWEEEVEIAGLTFTATAARHFSGRALTRNTTLWASWVLAGRDPGPGPDGRDGGRGRRVFYTGDSGYFDGYAAIGAAHGPFDVTLMQIGAYGAGWPDIHMTPEEGAAAHLDLGGTLLIPLHWATFNLALHDWAEPADRAWREAKARDIQLAVPRPGERVDVDNPPPVDGWWQAIA
jgi:L-ascorbate metabolism protein UlaG (beta-lactamase superfamily)